MCKLPRCCGDPCSSQQKLIWVAKHEKDKGISEGSEIWLGEEEEEEDQHKDEHLPLLDTNFSQSTSYFFTRFISPSRPLRE